MARWICGAELRVDDLEQIATLGIDSKMAVYAGDYLLWYAEYPSLDVDWSTRFTPWIKHL
jgi:hypothetical protein